MSKDLIGSRYGLLAVMGKDEGKKGRYYVCKCDCGNVKSVRVDHLKSGEQSLVVVCATISLEGKM